MSNRQNSKVHRISRMDAKTEADGNISVASPNTQQELLGDMVFVESPMVGRKLKAKENAR